MTNDLEPEEPVSDPPVIFGLFDSGGSRIADGKQAMINEATDKQDSERRVARSAECPGGPVARPDGLPLPRICRARPETPAFW